MARCSVRHRYNVAGAFEDGEFDFKMTTGQIKSSDSYSSSKRTKYDKKPVQDPCSTLPTILKRWQDEAAFRRMLYLTIQSSVSVEECAHTLLNPDFQLGWEEEICNIILDCCAQKGASPKYYGLLAQRLCNIKKTYKETFEKQFVFKYDICYRFTTDEICNITKLFAYLLQSDAISWQVISCIHLDQDETTTSSRAFINLLIQELAEFMGLQKLLQKNEMLPYQQQMKDCFLEIRQ